MKNLRNYDDYKINKFLFILSTLLSSCAHYLITISLLTYFVFESISSLKISLTVAITWIPSSLLLFIGGRWADRFNSKKMWIILELINSLNALLLGLFLLRKDTVLVFFGLFLKGCFDYAVRVLRIAVIPGLFPSALKTEMTAKSQVSFYAGFGLAGLLGSILLGHISVLALYAIAALFFASSAILLLFSKAVQSPPYKTTEIKSSYFSPLAGPKIILSSNLIWFPYFILAILATFFQGSFAVIQNIAPTELYSLSSNFVSFTHFVMGLSVILGAATFQNIDKNLKFSSKNPAQLTLVTLVGALLCAVLYQLAAVHSFPLFSILFYGIFVFIYEILFMLFFVNTLAHTPTNKLGEVTAFVHASCSLFQALMALITGAIATYLSIFSVVSVMIAFVLIGVALTIEFSKRHIRSL